MRFDKFDVDNPCYLVNPLSLEQFRSVAEYEINFLQTKEISEFVYEFVFTEEMLVHNFISGLKKDIRERVNLLSPTTLQGAINLAKVQVLQIEDELLFKATEDENEMGTGKAIVVEEYSMIQANSTEIFDGTGGSYGGQVRDGDKSKEMNSNLKEFSGNVVVNKSPVRNELSNASNVSHNESLAAVIGSESSCNILANNFDDSFVMDNLLIHQNSSSVTEYVEDFMHIKSRAEFIVQRRFDDSLLVYCFIGGLTAEIREALEWSAPRTLERAIDLATSCVAAAVAESKCGLVYGQLNEPPGANSAVSALLGRIPSAVGYQPKLATDLGGLQERITTTQQGFTYHQTLRTTREFSDVNLINQGLDTESEKFLIYRYMLNGDLSSSLYRTKSPDGDSLQSWDWITRLKLSPGVVEALSYLHQECTPLVHRDVHTSSTFLEDIFEVFADTYSRHEVLGVSRGTLRNVYNDRERPVSAEKIFPMIPMRDISEGIMCKPTAKEPTTAIINSGLDTRSGNFHINIVVTYDPGGGASGISIHVINEDTSAVVVTPSNTHVAGQNHVVRMQWIPEERIKWGVHLMSSSLVAVLLGNSGQPIRDAASHLPSAILLQLYTSSSLYYHRLADAKLVLASLELQILVNVYGLYRSLAKMNYQIPYSPEAERIFSKRYLKFGSSLRTRMFLRGMDCNGPGIYYVTWACLLLQLGRFISPIALTQSTPNKHKPSPLQTSMLAI